MRVELKPHPDTLCEAVERIVVEIARRDPHTVDLAYVVNGDIKKLVIPPRFRPKRTDELWKHTCFELFAQRETGGYSEFNFSPSWEWAAYEFDRYRAGMREKEDIAELRIEPIAEPDKFELRICLRGGLPSGPWRVALTAVIEETGGVMSYWALKHAPGKPDFHHADGFVLELP